jgi:hypothetical protein
MLRAHLEAQARRLLLLSACRHRCRPSDVSGDQNGVAGRQGLVPPRLPSAGDANEGSRELATVADVSGERVPGGVVHKLPTDLRQALTDNSAALDAWKDITPLARNEFICWVEDAKQDATRQRRIRRTQEELEEGQRRPCCWPGCRHRERTGK